MANGRVRRRDGDLHPKVVAAGVAALVVGIVLNLVQEFTGIPIPEGLDEYIVALVAFIAGYIKKGDGR